MTLRLSTGMRDKMLGINTNLLTNGDFETAIGSEWVSENGGSVAVDTNNPRSGTNAGRVTGTGADSGVYQAVTVVPGRLYKVTVWEARVVGGNTSSIKVGINGNIDKYSGENPFDYGDGLTGLDNSAYTQHDIYFIPEAGDTTIRLHILADGAYTYDFDDIEMVDMASSFQAQFKDSFIEIYTGTQPSSADDAPTGTLLVTIYSDGSSAGLEFGDSSSGTIGIKSGETWTGTAVNTGTAGWFRLKQAGDSGASSTTDSRMDGAVATSGAELNMSSTSITTGAIQAISTFTVTFPES